MQVNCLMQYMAHSRQPTSSQFNSHSINIYKCLPHARQCRETKRPLFSKSPHLETWIRIRKSHEPFFFSLIRQTYLCWCCFLSTPTLLDTLRLCRTRIFEAYTLPTTWLGGKRDLRRKKKILVNYSSYSTLKK